LTNFNNGEGVAMIYTKSSRILLVMILLQSLALHGSAKHGTPKKNIDFGMRLRARATALRQLRATERNNKLLAKQIKAINKSNVINEQLLNATRELIRVHVTMMMQAESVIRQHAHCNDDA